MVHGKKTYTVVLGGICVVLGMFAQGQIELMEGVMRILELLGIAGLRHGVSKGSK